MQFIKTIIAVIFGIFIFFGISVGLLAIFIGTASQSETVQIEENSVFKLSLNKEIVEIAEEDNPLEDLPIPAEFGGQVSKLSLINIKKAILKAKEDENIKGIYLDTDGIATGFAVMQEIRDALLDFKKTGKFIYTYASVYGEKEYYLSSVADRIFLNPAGAFELNGLNSEIMFFKNALDKIGVKPEVFRVGEYKSAIEPFILDKMSDANRLQVTAYLNSIYDTYLQNIGTSRNIDFKELKNISDQMLIQKPADALRFKLVTDTAYYDQVLTEIKKKLEIDEKKKIEFVGMDAVLKSSPDIQTEDFSDNKIAVLVAEGEIVDGKGDEDNIGGDKFAAEIRKLRENDKVKAVVLRINSPGGSALASEIMWREIMLLKKEKPVIASMSNVAASGGYYMAMACDTIVAQPNTITGSIGIFGLLFNTQDLMQNKIGLTFDRVNTGQFSDLGNPNRNISDAERQMIQNMVNDGYEKFTSKAAQGRKMSLENLKKVASGRVWTGIQAKEVGLIDAFGGLDEAIKIAAKSANLGEDFRVKYYPAQKNFMERLFEKSGSKVREDALKSEFGEFYPYFKQIQKVSKMKGVQARMPYDLLIN
ncbi:MAG: signal peptide peptidase SppA [Bacteroidetes bacterium]|nr:MAG: signal peptide peptidase SppA [Bacteroidota bacterium]